MKNSLKITCFYSQQEHFLFLCVTKIIIEVAWLYFILRQMIMLECDFIFVEQLKTIISVP